MKFNRKCIGLDCGKKFETIWFRQKYCTRLCATRDWNRKKIGWKPILERACLICGKMFTPIIRKPKTRICSHNCSKRFYFLTHREYFSKKAKEWQQNNREKYNKLAKEYRMRNPSKVAFSCKNTAHKRRAKIKDGNFSDEDWCKIIKFQMGRCWWCGRCARLTIDHIVPLTKGGRHSAENIVGACLSCNCKKSKSLWNVMNGALFEITTRTQNRCEKESGIAC